MATRFGSKMEIRRYAAAEDAFTSEGGYLAMENEVLDADAVADHEARRPARDFRKMVKRYAAGMSTVMTTFRAAGSRRAGQSANPSAS